MFYLHSAIAAQQLIPCPIHSAPTTARASCVSVTVPCRPAAHSTEAAAGDTCKHKAPLLSWRHWPTKLRDYRFPGKNFLKSAIMQSHGAELPLDLTARPGFVSVQYSIRPFPSISPQYRTFKVG